ncbi:MAG: apolipoprotein N-acyltransferase, partial [Jannaschia sp.]
PAPLAEADAPVIRLVQPNAPQDLKWNPDWISIFFQRGLAATAAPPDGRAPTAYLWPETSLPDLLRQSEDARARIATAAGGAPVVIGVQRFDTHGAPRNALALLTGEAGEVAEVHDKHRLVPFGEYLPLPRVAAALGIGPLAAQLAGRYAAGEGPALIDIPGVGPVLPMICYEAIFPQDIRAVPRPRAILHLTNDAWFGTFAGPRQHLALARLRAAESGLPLLRAANTGVSAAIDARGAVLAARALGETGHLDAALPPALPPTIYTRTGDWAVLAMLLSLGAPVVFSARRRSVVKRERRIPVVGRPEAL